MSQYQSLNGHQTIKSIKCIKSKKKKRSLLFDRVQNETKISDFRKLINKNVNIYHIDEHKRTIIMFAASNYHFEVFIYLINNYPKLILNLDDQDMNIMHYIASSKEDDESMVESITNKKYHYNKLVWMRNKNGELPKDIAKQCNNKRITKQFESIMHDTWSLYHHIARNNNIDRIIKNINNLNINDADIDSDSYSEDMDMDQPQKTTLSLSLSSIKPISISQIKPISIGSRKRRHHHVTSDNDDYENDNIYIKRRKLNCSGSYLRTTPQTATLSPSPLPPLPPTTTDCCYMTPFSLNGDDSTTSEPMQSNPDLTGKSFSYLSSDNSSTHSSLFLNDNNDDQSYFSYLPSTFLTLTNTKSNILPLTPPKLIRSRAIDNMITSSPLFISCHHNKYQIMARNSQQEMTEISNAFYNGQTISKQQFMFIEWYRKQIGRNQFLPMIIEKGYDELNKFMTLTKESCIKIFGVKRGYALLLAMQSEIKILSKNRIFGEYNNNICIGSIGPDVGPGNVEMDKFNERMRDLRLSPYSPSISHSSDWSTNANKNESGIDRMDQEEQKEEEDIDRDRNHLISDIVINSSDSLTDDVFAINNNNNNNRIKGGIIPIPWAYGQCGKSSEDDDL